MEAFTASRAGTVAPPVAVLRLLSDERLTRLAASGSEAAFAAIFERHHQALHRYCHAIVGNTHDAADALQNTMVKALRALPGETREIALKPWLYRLAHNESISLLRARRPDSNLDAAADVADRAGDGVLESRQRLRDLTADLRELSEQQRGALLMRELGGLQFADVAGALAVSAATAKQSVYEARCALHAMQEGRAMECDVMRRALSDGDRRTLRAIKLRSHLRACAGCRDFETALRHRPAQLAAIVPPLPLGLAAAMLDSVLGGSGHGGHGGSGDLATGLSTGAGQSGSGGLAASLGAAGAKAGGALTLGTVKIAAVVAVAGSAAGGAVYVAPHGQATRTAPSALMREAASASKATTSLSAARTGGRVAETSPAATQKAGAARVLARQQPDGASAATASAGREQSAGDVGQVPTDAYSAAGGRGDRTSRQPTQMTASDPATAQNRPMAAETTSTAAGAPSTYMTSPPTATQPAGMTVTPTAPVAPAPSVTVTAPVVPAPGVTEPAASAPVATDATVDGSDMAPRSR